MRLFKKNEEKILCSVVVVAAGASERFGSDKLFAPLAGKPVLAHTLAVLESCESVSEIVVVAPRDGLLKIAELCDQYAFSKVRKVVVGGATRVESALCGASETDRNAKLIAIHDGARPLVTRQIVEEAIAAARRYRAAAPAIPAKDTVKLAKDEVVTETPPRANAFLVQTPQVFDPALIKGALTNALEKQLFVTDDASALEALGYPVHLTAGSEENIKITTPLDLRFAETIIAARGESACE
ncbi:MAG: 2-C-methyl-D-erythritol 4-phosphate cytidylyltransferase [Oscillospiraceae bacterium]|jgi:2-C-methyl-D-erythritol 4-phosphate cytidylyltransferase